MAFLMSWIRAFSIVIDSPWVFALQAMLKAPLLNQCIGGDPLWVRGFDGHPLHCVKILEESMTMQKANEGAPSTPSAMRKAEALPSAMPTRPQQPLRVSMAFINKIDDKKPCQNVYFVRNKCTSVR